MRIISGKNRGTKLYTLEGINTRPTLDRVKEPLFSILNCELEDSVVLDLFAGSGALGLEAISRGASKAVLCDDSKEAIHIIEKNVEKMSVHSKVKILNNDYFKALETLKKQNYKFDIVFLDPPYNTDFSEKASEKIVEYNLLNENGIIVIETDRKKEIVENIKNLNLFEIFDERKYGRAELIFLKKSKVGIIDNIRKDS